MDRPGLAALLGAAAAVAEPPPGPTVVEGRTAGEFQAAFARAVAAGGPVFLADPAWSAGQRAAAWELMRRPDRKPRDPAAGWLMIPTGGTGGTVKFARHDEETIWEAVRGYAAHLGGAPARAVGVLPLHHVGGLMAWLRGALTGGGYVDWDWKRLESGRLPGVGHPEEWTISLVPTQLVRLLQRPEVAAWLRQLRAVYCGGGPGWPGLFSGAAAAGIPLSPCYGMTETAAMAAALAPADFRRGARDCGAALPHVRLTISGDGRIRVAGESVFRGYWPEFSDRREFDTPDLGSIDAGGHLHVEGRADAVIVTGGRKVNPAEVEEALRASGEFEDIAVVGVPDPEWGEAVVAGYPAGGAEPELGRVEAALRQLPAHARPKRYLAVAPWPRNAQGKIDRLALRQTLRAMG